MRFPEQDVIDLFLCEEKFRMEHLQSADAEEEDSSKVLAYDALTARFYLQPTHPNTSLTIFVY
jgi:hypothetical protein